MYDQAFIKQLKQSNISADGEKTKQRAKEYWKGASNADKDAMQELAGISRNSIYRVYETGNISVKVAVAFAQIRNVDPRYLTGEIDEPGECSDEVLRDFLMAHGYEKLLQTQPRPRRRRGKAAAAAEPESIDNGVGESDVPDELVVLAVEAAVPENSPNPMRQMSEDEMLLLMRSIMLRVKLNAPGAKERADRLIAALLS